MAAEEGPRVLGLGRYLESLNPAPPNKRIGAIKATLKKAFDFVDDLLFG